MVPWGATTAAFRFAHGGQVRDHLRRTCRRLLRPRLRTTPLDVHTGPRRPSARPGHVVDSHRARCTSRAMSPYAGMYDPTTLMPSWAPGPTTAPSRLRRKKVRYRRTGGGQQQRAHAGFMSTSADGAEAPVVQDVHPGGEPAERQEGSARVPTGTRRRWASHASPSGRSRCVAPPASTTSSPIAIAPLPLKTAT